uniref:Amino acid transporter transmembrane domain-containing protein n=1 Tax=Pseudo-nitzschia australis TaxID=44445 RepID=A0A7S4AQA0_9STRA|mmetsp:Transcript_20355/g.43055  ORF Transcript_20355/g.43055 Transcript_20355/m.43055 type:complete len:629 (-) Transcript_20355:77-1963(-)
MTSYKVKYKTETMGQTTPIESDVGSNGSGAKLSESTRLLQNDNESLQLSVGLGASATSPDEDSALWNEMDAPWPATFDRAISLLASPVIKADRAKDLTKSPKPGNTPIAIRRRMIKRSNSADTPEFSGLVPPRSRLSFRTYIDEEKRDMDFQTTKAHLQAQAKFVPLSKARKDMESKSTNAAEYRKKILAKQQGRKSSSPSSEEKTSFLQCVFNLANILMGVGLLGLPFAFSKAGYFGGTFAILTFALVCWKTSILIGRELNGDPRPLSLFTESALDTKRPPGSSPVVRMRKSTRSFPDIAREAFGDVGAIILGVILYFELFSCLSIFIVSVGDHMHELFPSVPVTTHMLGFAIFSALPVIVFRTAGLLSYLSLVGTIATICVVLAVVFCYLIEGDITEELASKSDSDFMQDTESYHRAWNTGGLDSAFGLVAFCFSGHAIVPSIYTSMEKPHEFEQVVNVTFMVVVAACMAIGLSGYTMFGDFVLDQITLSLNQNSSAVLAMEVLTWLMILTAFSKLTLTMFPLAMGFEEIFAPYISTDSSMVVVGAMIKVTLLFGALAVAVYVPSFSVLCSMVGMICTMAVSVIFPAGAYLKLFWPKLPMMERMLYLFLVAVGIVMAVVGTALGIS